MFPYVMTTTLVDDHAACTLIQSPLLDISKWANGITLSCGTNESVDFSSTVQHIVMDVVRRYRAHMPLEAWQRRCNDFLRKLDIMVGRKRSDGRPQQNRGGREGGGEWYSDARHTSSVKGDSISGGGNPIFRGYIVPPEDVPEQGDLSAGAQSIVGDVDLSNLGDIVCSGRECSGALPWLFLISQCSTALLQQWS